MPEVIIHDLSTVTVDGQHVGALTDYLANYGRDKDGKPIEGIHSATLASLNAHIDTIHARHNADKASMKATHDEIVASQKQAFADQAAAHTEALAKLKADHQAAIEQLAADHDAKVQALEAKSARRDQMLDALGGAAAFHGTRAERLRAAKEREAHHVAAVAAIEAEDDGEAGA